MSGVTTSHSTGRAPETEPLYEEAMRLLIEGGMARNVAYDRIRNCYAAAGSDPGAPLLSAPELADLARRGSP